MNKQQVIIIYTIILIVLLSFFIVLILHSSVSENGIIYPVEKQKKDIDNRISPLTNQGLFLEIKRIRHRGLLENLLSSQTQWKKSPSFIIEIEIDDMIYSGDIDPDLQFFMWDTIFHERRVMRDVEEEKNESKVIISIIEQKKTMLNKRVINQDVCELRYNYKTGHWNGDDYLKDTDGYGHFVGKIFECWFNIYQTDYDHDLIPYWTEVNILHTDPFLDDSTNDADNDGIPATWEYRWGYDPYIFDNHNQLDPDIDGIQNIEEYAMQKWFADPFSPDIYLEVDGMEKKGLCDWVHRLYEESKQALIERFCAHGINLYIDSVSEVQPSISGGEILPYKDIISWNSGTMLQYYLNHFSDERKGIFRYCLIADKGIPNGFCGNVRFNTFDTIMVGTNRYTTIFKRTAFTPRTFRIVLASSILHELGHSLGIGPNTIEGCDNISFYSKILPTKQKKEFLEVWGNYRSVMNYFYIFDKDLLDFSDGSHGYNDQNDWGNIYLPTFEIEFPEICEPNISIEDKAGPENISIQPNNWTYSQELTEEYKHLISREVFSIHDTYEYKVFIKKKDFINNSYNVRIYSKPNVPITSWSLIRETNI